MTRRKGIIAALCTFAGIYLPSKAVAQKEDISLSPTNLRTWLLSSEIQHPYTAFVLQINDLDTSKGDIALEVRIGNRIVKLTGEEIMDALEGK